MHQNDQTLHNSINAKGGVRFLALHCADIIITSRQTGLECARESKRSHIVTNRKVPTNGDLVYFVSCGVGTRGDIQHKCIIGIGCGGYRRYTIDTSRGASTAYDVNVVSSSYDA